MGTVQATHDFYSIGQLAAHLQKPVRSIESAATELQITPAMRINGIPHFDGEQVARLSQQLTKGTAT
jgi:hypothetical protein